MLSDETHLSIMVKITCICKDVCCTYIDMIPATLQVYCGDDDDDDGSGGDCAGDDNDVVVMMMMMW